MKRKQEPINESANGELNSGVRQTPLAFMRRFGTGRNRISQDFGAFNFPNFFTSEFEYGPANPKSTDSRRAEELRSQEARSRATGRKI
jgi:hypothetical protein